MKRWKRAPAVVVTRTSLGECVEVIRASASAEVLEEAVALYKDGEMGLVHLQEACAVAARGDAIKVQMTLQELLALGECSCWFGDTGGTAEEALDLLKDVRAELEIRKDLDAADVSTLLRVQERLEETHGETWAAERDAVWAVLAEEVRSRVGVAARLAALEVFRVEEELDDCDVDTTPVWLGVRSWPESYEEVEALRRVLGVARGSRAVVELPMWAALELVGIAREVMHERLDVTFPRHPDVLETVRVIWADGADSLVGAIEVAEAL